MTESLKKLKAHLGDAALIGKANAILGWDMEVMMPPDAADERGRMMGALSVLSHEKNTDPRIGDWIAEARRETNEPLELRNLDLIEENYKLARVLPERLVRELSEVSTACVTTWHAAKPANDWQAVKPQLEKMFAVTREQAVIYGEVLGKTPYDALLGLYARNNSVTLIDGLFNELEAVIPSLVDQIVAQQTPRPDVNLSVETQEKTARKLIEAFGFSTARGRLDVSSHPFSGGTKYDSRITTRFSKDLPFGAIMGVIHETGHALYTQNTPGDWDDMPVGADSDLSLHESQSLLLERQVALSPAFISYMHDVIRGIDAAAVKNTTAQDMIGYLHHVERDLIRVESNEVTYPLHVILRYRLEKALFAGNITVADLPEAWNTGFKELMGIDVPDNRHGVLQDTHWYGGAFGYFPTYTQGAVYAAQIFAALRRALPDVDADIARGHFTPMMQWLHANIHNQGQFYDIPDLIAKATGEPPTARYFVEHLKARYLKG